jgi:hypothetical protein
MKLSVVRPTPGALVVLLGTSSNGDGSSGGRCCCGEGREGAGGKQKKALVGRLQTA